MVFKDVSLRTPEGRKQTIRIIHEDHDLVVLDIPPGIPVIPDHNNGEENIRATAEFISDDLGNNIMQLSNWQSRV